MSNDNQIDSREVPLTGNWHHGNGVLVCGTVRVATANFDTNPSDKVKAEILDWMCNTLNAALAHTASQVPEVEAEPEAWKPLTDVQWMNIVNHEQAWNSYSKEEAVHEAVKMTEAKCRENNPKPQPQACSVPDGEVVVTCDMSGKAVLVSRQDDDGQILSVIWESEAPYGAFEHVREGQAHSTPAAATTQTDSNNDALIRATVEACAKACDNAEITKPADGNIDMANLVNGYIFDACDYTRKTLAQGIRQITPDQVRESMK